MKAYVDAFVSLEPQILIYFLKKALKRPYELQKAFFAQLAPKIDSPPQKPIKMRSLASKTKP